MPSKPARIIQKVAPGPPMEIATANAANIPDANRAGHGSCQRLEVRNFAVVFGAGVVTANKFQSVPETANIDEPEIESEENSANDEPKDD